LKQVREYRQHAEECRALAAKVRYPDHKAQLLDLASRWETLADEREKMLAQRRKLEQNGHADLSQPAAEAGRGTGRRAGD
jgi:hypothetical protein